MNLNIQRFDGGENVTGYSVNGINSVLDGVRESYDNFYNSLDNDVRNTIDSISHLWASGTAQNFFKNRFKPIIEELFQGQQGVNNCVKSILSAVSNAGNNWAKELQNNDSFSGDFAIKYLGIGVEPIQDHFPDQTAGADIEATKNEAESQLSTMKQHVTECCENLKNAVDKAAFLDTEGLQRTSLKSAIDKVNESFEETIDTIKNAMITDVETETNDIKSHAAATQFDVQ